MAVQVFTRVQAHLGAPRTQPAEAHSTHTRTKRDQNDPLGRHDSTGTDRGRSQVHYTPIPRLLALLATSTHPTNANLAAPGRGLAIEAPQPAADGTRDHHKIGRFRGRAAKRHSRHSEACTAASCRI